LGVRDEPEKDGSTARVPVVELSMLTEKWWGRLSLGARTMARPRACCVAGSRSASSRKSCRIFGPAICAFPGSDRYSDYRDSFVNEDEYRKKLASYGERAGIPVDARACVNSLKIV
jgi:hypothetical protein